MAYNNKYYILDFKKFDSLIEANNFTVQKFSKACEMTPPQFSKARHSNVGFSMRSVCLILESIQNLFGVKLKLVDIFSRK